MSFKSIFACNFISDDDMRSCAWSKYDVVVWVSMENVNGQLRKLKLTYSKIALATVVGSAFGRAEAIFFSFFHIQFLNTRLFKALKTLLRWQVWWVYFRPLLISFYSVQMTYYWLKNENLFTTKAKSESNRKAIMKSDSSQLEKKPIS